ncbi:hypothetical protein [uncultured Thomasclavelia sp.]|uniref:hypothetical protein n=1 Tax=uncultured Thomasclavelia sp. TaxID=3025759 RepID=UPI002593BDA1|nr:hypothetical protein [uncultured Thomasclavelia sp.]
MNGTPKQIINFLLEQDPNKKFEIKEYKEKRNKDQNAKYWKLLNELALTLKISVEQLHFNMLKDYSSRYQVLVPNGQEIRGIDYYEKKSTILKDDKKWDVYYVFTPSHELNTKEFAFLLSGVIQECKNVGIETISPDELAKWQAIINESRCEYEYTNKNTKGSR